MVECFYFDLRIQVETAKLVGRQGADI